MHIVRLSGTYTAVSVENIGKQETVSVLNHFNDPANCTFSTQPFFMGHFKTICAIPSMESTYQHYAYDLNMHQAFISKIIQCFNGAKPLPLRISVRVNNATRC